MNSPFKLLLAIVLSLFCFVNLQAQSTTSAVNKDTVSNYYRLMNVRILADSNSQQIEQKISLTTRQGKPTSIDFSRVYELSFYLISDQSVRLSMVLYSENDKSEKITFQLEPSTGRYQKVIFPMALGGNVDPEKITSLIISLEVESNTSNKKIQIDEFVFNYFEIPQDLEGKPNFDNETLRKEYEAYIDNNRSPKQNIEPTDDDTWTKGNKSVKSR